MKTFDKILALYDDIDFLKAEGLDDAIIGVDERNLRLVYSIEACINILNKDMPWEDAVEYFEYNVLNTYLGEKTPIFVNLVH